MNTIPTAGFSPVQPFDELLCSLHDVDKVAHEIKEKGYFELAINQITLDLLRSVPVRPLDAIYAFGDKTVDHRIGQLPGAPVNSGQIENALTAAMERLTQKLCELANPLRLQTQEFSVRQPDRTAASTWHVDRAPKVLTLLSTITGSPTQYVDLSVGNQAINPDRLAVEDERKELLEANLREFKPAHYYLFAAAGIHKHGEGKTVPLLVHKAPGDEERSFLLARWLPKSP